jgi:hypothetical protein
VDYLSGIVFNHSFTVCIMYFLNLGIHVQVIESDSLIFHGEMARD